MLKRRGLIALALVGAMILAACGGGAKQEGTKPQEKAAAPAGPKGEIVYASSADPVNFNPILASDSVSYWVIYKVFSSLVRWSPKMEIEGDLAEKWESTPDGKVWTFKLRPGVKFHDGKPLTAKDVAFTFNAIKDPGYTGPRTSTFAALEKAEVVDELTVKFTLKEVFAPFLTTLTTYVMPAHLFEGKPVKDFKDHPNTLKPVGSGPYKFVEWKKGEYIALEANRDYYVKGQPGLELQRLKFVKDVNVSVAAFEAGEIDEIIPPAKDVDRLVNSMKGKVTTYEYPDLGYGYMGINQERPGLKEKAVRQAIAYAVNRDQIIKDIFKGKAILSHGDIPPASPFYNPNIPKYEYNPDKAKKLLDDAGWKLGPEGVRAKDGVKLKYTLTYNTGNVTRESMALLIQKNLKDVGFDIKVEHMEWSVFLDKYIWFGNYDLMFTGFLGSPDPDGMFSRYHSSQAEKNAQGRFKGFNRVGFKNAEVDKLLEESRTATDPAKRKAVIGQLQVKLAEELPWLWIYHDVNTDFIKNKYQNLVKGWDGLMFPYAWTDGDAK